MISENERLAKRLRTLRKVAGLTQIEVADKAGISHSYYPYLEQAKYSPSVNMLKRIAKILNVDLSELLK